MPYVSGTSTISQLSTRCAFDYRDRMAMIDISTEHLDSEILVVSQTLEPEQSIPEHFEKRHAAVRRRQMPGLNAIRWIKI